MEISLTSSLKNFFKKIQLTTFNLKKAIIYGLIASVIIFLLVTFLGVILLTTETVQPEDDISNATQITQSIPNYALLLVMLITTSILEEIFFRGILLVKIREHTQETITIMLTSMVFAFVHILYMQIFTIIMAFIMGIILAYIVLKTKNLFSSITAHVVYNLIVLIIIS